MFRKLQHRFMWVSTLVLLLVVCVVTGVVYWITSEVIMSQTGVLMELILENDGDLPERSEFNANQEMFLALNVESMYEMRFISAEETDGDIELIRMHIAMLSEEDALSLAQTALNHRGGMGRIKIAGKRIFHYARSTADDGSTMVVVLDSTSRYGLQRLIMMIMAAAALVLMLFVHFIVQFVCHNSSFTALLPELRQKWPRLWVPARRADIARRCWRATSRRRLWAALRPSPCRSW